MKKYAALYCRDDSAYKLRPQWDVWDKERDASLYAGNLPVVCHPPCRMWSNLNYIHRNYYPNELCYPWQCVDIIMAKGGILEHPLRSRIWQQIDLLPGLHVPINQFDFGHITSKQTRLWIYPSVTIPPLPMPKYDYPQQRIGTSTDTLPRKYREYTPEKLIDWFENVLDKITNSIKMREHSEQEVNH